MEPQHTIAVAQTSWSPELGEENCRLGPDSGCNLDSRTPHSSQSEWPAPSAKSLFHRTRSKLLGLRMAARPKAFVSKCYRTINYSSRCSLLHLSLWIRCCLYSLECRFRYSSVSTVPVSRHAQCAHINWSRLMLSVR